MYSKITPEDILNDVLNFYGVKASVFQAAEYLEMADHPTPAGFLEWLKKTK